MGCSHSARKPIPKKTKNPLQVETNKYKTLDYREKQ